MSTLGYSRQHEMKILLGSTAC